MYCAEAKECVVPNPLQTYFRDINQTSLLSAVEERELAGDIARGDSDARNRLIKANLRLVVKIARDYLGRGMGLDDLIGEGNLGLIRAAEDYDPRFGTRFSTYASYWIKQAIRHALINTTATIRLPAHMVVLMTKWRRQERALCRENGCQPSFDEVATALGLTETQRELVVKARRASQLKLESGIGDDDGSWTPDESLDAHDGPDAAMEAEDECWELMRRMNRLDDRERLVLSLRFGLEGQKPLTLKEIGRRLGVTREWVRKIEIRAVHKLEEAEDPAPAPVPTRGRPRGPRTASIPQTAVSPAAGVSSKRGSSPTDVPFRGRKRVRELSRSTFASAC